jgi:hypothetical protein
MKIKKWRVFTFCGFENYTEYFCETILVVWVILVTGWVVK